LRKRAFRLSLFAMILALATGDAAILVPRSSATGQRAQRPHTVHRLPAADGAFLLARIHRARHETWRWQTLMGVRLTRSARAAEHVRRAVYRRWIWHLWQQRAKRAAYLAHHPPRLRSWLCIHRYEGAWTDPNPPYFGGLQMDIGFQRAYGQDLLLRKGTADHWTPLEQIWVAERAYRSGRGFYPWPNTARYCGLI
jgi:hypothetical protein